MEISDNLPVEEFEKLSIEPNGIKQIKRKLKEEFQDRLYFPKGPLDHSVIRIAGFYAEEVVADGKALYDEVTVSHVSGELEANIFLNGNRVFLNDAGYEKGKRTLESFYQLKFDLQIFLAHAKAHITFMKLKEHFQGILTFELHPFCEDNISITGFFPEKMGEATPFDEVIISVCLYSGRMLGTLNYHLDDCYFSCEDIGYEKVKWNVSTFEELMQEIQMLLNFVRKKTNEWKKIRKLYTPFHFMRAELEEWSNEANGIKTKLEKQFKDNLCFPQGRVDHHGFIIAGFYAEDMIGANGKANFDEVAVSYVDGTIYTTLILNEDKVFHPELGYKHYERGNKIFWNFEDLRREIGTLVTYAKAHTMLTKLKDHFQDILSFPFPVVNRWIIRITGFFSREMVNAAPFDEVVIYTCKNGRMVGNVLLKGYPVSCKEIGYEKEEWDVSTFEELTREIQMLLNVARKVSSSFGESMDIS